MRWLLPVTLQELEIGKRSAAGNLHVTAFHVVTMTRRPFLGFRFEAEGKVIAFSGDTQSTDSLIDVGRDADLFLFEACMRARRSPGSALSLLEQHLQQSGRSGTSSPI